MPTTTILGWRAGCRAAATLLLVPVLAAAIPVGPEIQVNTYTTDRQRVPSVARDAAGNFVVVWQSEGSVGGDADGTSIQGRRYDATGAPLAGQFQVNTYTTGDQYAPAVASDAAGNFAVVWHTTDGIVPDQDGLSVRARFFDNTGAALGPAFLVNTYTTGDQHFPAIASDGAGNFVIAWQSDGSYGTDTSGRSIQGQRFDGTAATIGGEFQVNSHTPGVQRYPAVGADAAGNFVIAWNSDTSAGTDTSLRSIQARLYDSLGVPGGQFQVNTYTTSYQLYPAVAVAPAGNFIVVWSSFGGSGTDVSAHSIQAQRYNSSGLPSSGQFQVNTIFTAGSQNNPTVAAGADGRFVVAWNSNGSAGTDTSNYSVHVASLSGGLEAQVNTYTTSRQSVPAVAALDAGNFVVVWESVGSAGTDTDGESIQAQRFASTTTSTSSSSTSSTSSTTSTTLVGCDATPVGGCVVAASGQLLVKEQVAGAERLKVLMKDLPTIVPNQFGDPVTNATAYAVCLYDQADALLTTLIVDRAGDTCDGVDCWKLRASGGYRYSDRDVASDGIQKILLKSGDAGSGKLLIKGKNNAAQGQTTLPTGIAAALEDHTQARVQLRTSDADCFEVTVTDVRRNDGEVFKALQP